MRTSFTSCVPAYGKPTLRIGLTSWLIAMFFATSVLAQDRTLSGTVTSEDTGEGLPGVNVIVKGTTQGTVTDIEGTYRLSAPEDAEILTFTFIGMESKEVEIGNQSEISITMAEDAKQLSEVVVTALGIEREERALGYSVQEISGEAVSDVKETNIVNSLAGKVAGVQITGASGNMGGSSRILIRGVNSISGNNQPLFVIDGVPVDNSNYTSATQETGRGGYDYGNMIQDLNPDNIASISVLKGASAAALYGTRASNGVILITTKSGKGRKGLGVDINSSVTFDNVYVLPNYQNSYGGGLGPFQVNEAGENIPLFAVDESWGPRLDGRPARQWYSYFADDPDFGQTTPWVGHPGNVEDFFNTGITYNNTIALSGSNETSNIRLSVGSVNQDFVLPNSNLDRYTIGFNGRTQLSDKLYTAASATYVASEAVGRPGTGYDGNNVMQQFNQWSHRQVSMDKLSDYVGPDGIQRTWNITSPTDLSPKYSDNPYWIRNKNYQNDNRQRLYGFFETGYEFTDWLKLRTKWMTDHYNDRREERIAIGSQATSEYREGLREFTEVNRELLLQVDKPLESGLSITGYLGGNIMTQQYARNVVATRGGLSIPDFYNIKNSISPEIETEDYLEKKQINSLFGNVSLGWNDIIYLDASLRNDWSSTLPDGNNSYLYPSVSTSFIFSELGGLQNNEILSMGKLRAAWGQVGSDTNPFRLTTTLEPKANFGDNPDYSVPNSQNNPNLRPETTTSWEVGTNLGFFQNRVALDVTYYNVESIDQIIAVDVSPTSGFTRQWINAGKITNQGVEVSLNITPLELSNGLKWDIALNWARNRNEVVELAEGVDTYVLGSIPFSGDIVAREGQPYGVILGTGVQKAPNGSYILSKSATAANYSYMRTDNLVPLGNAMPDWTGGVSSTLNFKGIVASVLVDGQKGGDIFSVSNMFGKYSGMFEETVAGGIRERGVIPTGVVNTGTAESPQYASYEDEVGAAIPADAFFGGLYGRDEFFVYDASFIKLREARIGYSLPNSIIGNSPFRNITVSVVGRNLAILYKNIPHLDPEAAVSTSNVQGIEGAQLPSIRSWGFSVNLGL